MRQYRKMMIGAVLAVVCAPSAKAGLINSPIGMAATAKQIKFEAPTLPPMAYSVFCVRYADECRRRPRFRGPSRLSDERLAELKEVNETVNQRIIPERNERGLAGETWLINPTSGDCNDYAVSKRSELIRMGWSANNLLLGEVIIRSGEHHLVLVVRTTAGDLVLDNLNSQIKQWSKVPYRWARVQLPDQPKLWSTVGTRKA